MKAYMIKFAFVDSKPLIWRRIVLPANGTFYRLHQIIQTATNFKSVYEPYHTYQFQMGQVYVVDNRMREEALLESGGEIHLARRTKFDDYFEKHQEMRYTYDFGDNWQIDIRLEQVVDDYHFGYPTILAGEHNAPPEDVGGLSGFADFIKSYENPSHPDYLNALQWAEGRGYRPFSMEDINERLKVIKYQKTDWTKIHHENYKIISDPYRPPDIVNTKEIDDKELIAHYAIAAANLYGALTLEKFAEIYNAHNQSAWSVTQLKNVLNAPLYRKVLKDGYTYLRYDWIMEASVDEFGYLLELIEMTEGKPYYIPPKKEFLRYTDHFYFEKTKAVAALTKILADDFYGGSSLMAYEDVEDIVLDCNLFNHDIHDVIQSFLFRHEVESEGQMKKYVAAIINVANHVRLWENRGHTPSELVEMERAHLKPIAEPAFTVVQGGKIGRNDPCPCGSGKKYKKCCGK